jgi:low temperature requirement protein LtrA
VLAITQLSDFLFLHRSPRGALEAPILFLAVWWAWNYTAGDELDRSRAAPRGPVDGRADGDQPRHVGGDSRGLRRARPGLAAAYVLLQLVRSSFIVVAFRKGERMRRTCAQLLAWSAIAGVPWIAGALVHGDARIVLWVAALVIDLGAPAIGFRSPASLRWS